MYEDLKNYIQSIVKPNGNEEITGTNMQQVLKTIVDIVGLAEFRGVAVPGTNPGPTETPAIYMAATAGVYANFNGIELAQGELASIRWNGVAWVKETIQSYISDIFIRDNRDVAFVQSLIKLKGDEETEVTILKKVNGIVVGGIVSWSGTGLTFNVSYVVYLCNNIPFTISATSFTLDAADPALDRIDVVTVNDQGAVEILKGTPAASPIKPQVDFTQIELTYIVVPAGATQPVVNELVIWNENIESVGAATDITANFDNLVNPYIGLKAVNASNVLSGGKLTFTLSAPQAVADFTTLSMFFRLKQNIPTGAKIFVQFFNGADSASNEVPLIIESTLLNTYQFVAIALSDFRFTSDEFDILQLRYSGFNFNGFYLDYIRLEGGITPPAPDGWFWDVMTEGGIVRQLIRPGDNAFFQPKAGSRIKMYRTAHFTNGNVLEIDFDETGLGGVGVEDSRFEYRDLADGNLVYILDPWAIVGYTILGAVLYVDSGSAAGVIIKINGTAVTGLDGITATTTRQKFLATANNVVPEEGLVTMHITGAKAAGTTTIVGKLIFIRN
jgi:hypothetical protein